MRRNAGNEQKRRWEALKGQLNTASATLFLSGTQSSLSKGKPQKNQTVLSSGQTHTLYKYQTQLQILVICASSGSQGKNLLHNAMQLDGRCQVPFSESLLLKTELSRGLEIKEHPQVRSFSLACQGLWGKEGWIFRGGKQGSQSVMGIRVQTAKGWLRQTSS